MIIKLSPQIRDFNKIWYEVTDNKIKATINNVSDTFDFTDMPDGELQMYDDEGNSLIETALSEVPIINAKKEDGILTVEILFSIDTSEQDERLLFPKPMTLEEFNDLMDELKKRDKAKDEGGERFSYESDTIDLEEVDF